MSPVTTPSIVTSFAPDISGDVFVCLQSPDGNSNARILITQEQKGSLSIGDPLNLTIGTAEVEGAEVNEAAGESAALANVTAANEKLKQQLEQANADIAAARTQLAAHAEAQPDPATAPQEGAGEPAAAPVDTAAAPTP